MIMARVLTLLNYPVVQFEISVRTYGQTIRVNTLVFNGLDHFDGEMPFTLKTNEFPIVQSWAKYLDGKPKYRQKHIPSWE